MQIYHYDPSTLVLFGSSIADESPLEPGVLLVPAHATDITPPEFNPDTHICRFVDNAWILEAISKPEPNLDTTPSQKTTKEIAAESIAMLEAQANSPRLMREAVLGISESVQILSGFQTLIEAARLKLKEN